jgi:hypothetical protein
LKVRRFCGLGDLKQEPECFNERRVIDCLCQRSVGGPFDGFGDAGNAEIAFIEQGHDVFPLPAGGRFSET